MRWNIYSKRNNEQENGPCQCEPIGEKMRMQTLYILYDFLKAIQGWGANPLSDSFFEKIYDILTREYGVSHLRQRETRREQVINFFIAEKDFERVSDTDKTLDFIELAFSIVSQIESTHMLGHPQQHIDEQKRIAIDTLNARFKENNLCYRFQTGYLIKTDNDVLNEQITKPVRSFLSKMEYSTISDEYLSAQGHYLHGRNKECLNDCLKAFETTMKVICGKMKWSYDRDKDTSSKLINILYDNNFFPGYLLAEISGFRATLASGIPTIRNRSAGHGQGEEKVVVHDNFASYCLNLTGTTIKFFIELLEEHSA